MMSDIDEIVKLIDSSMSGGAGHLNLTIDENSVETEITTTRNICGKDMACSVPTLHEGIDD